MAASPSVESPKLTLYSYWISSCAFRVRFALNVKGLKYEYKAVHLHKFEQYTPEYKKLNPTSTVPLLVDGDVVVGDSLAIILYLEEKYPQTPLLPSDPQKRAINYQAATIVSSGIQPFQNLYGLMGHLEPLQKLHLTFTPDKKLEWLQDHIKKGLAALEDLLTDHSGIYATGDEVALADMYLAPQIDAAMKRFGVDMDEFPLLKRLNDAYNELPAFLDAHPSKQPDAPENLK